ncbi:hypothetical protein QUC31_002655 [Theobroma cacao]
MVMNTHGKPRLAKFYEYLWKSSRSLHEAFLRVPISYQHSSSSSSSSYFSFLCCRAENVSNFIEAESIFGPDSRLLYKHFATLDFVVVYSSEIELAVLDLIQARLYEMMFLENVYGVCFRFRFQTLLDGWESFLFRVSLEVNLTVFYLIAYFVDFVVNPLLLPKLAEH